MVTAMLVKPLTVVVAVLLSLPVFGSGVDDATVAVLLSTVPVGTLALTATTRVKVPVPTFTEAFVQLTVPPEPTGGVVHDQPAAELSETKVVPVGKVSVTDQEASLLGTPLPTLMV
jgi:hypothetical protein